MGRNSARALNFQLFSENSEDRLECRPFVKWVGGKTQLLRELTKRIPQDVAKYYEPFIGGGALFFNYQPKNAYISDINPELINAYKVIRDDVESLIKSLKKHVYAEDYFYKIRNIDRTSKFGNWSEVERASRLIYLNKTCYNGLYRVNQEGHFNTPFGKYTNPKIVDEDNLRACSAMLKNVTIRLAPFWTIANSIKPHDFVYFDPPYVPLSDTAYFTSYNRVGFNLETQKTLFELCCKLDQKHIRFMLSNSSTPFVKKLYKNFNVEVVHATRAINSKAARRGQIDEVIVTNF